MNEAEQSKPESDLDSYGCVYLEIGHNTFHHNPPTMITLKQFQSMQFEKEDEIFTSVFRYSKPDPYDSLLLSGLVFDFDSKTDLQTSRMDALRVVRFFVDNVQIPEEAIRLIFTGMKGFRLFFNWRLFDVTPNKDLPAVWRFIARKIKQELKLNSLDLQIYTRRTMTRLVNSKHRESGLYAIPLTISELKNLSIDEIVNIAKSKRSISLKPTNELKPVPKAIMMLTKTLGKLREIDAKWQGGEVKEVKTFEELPTWVKQRLSIPVEMGSRDITIFQTACALRQYGIPKETAQRLCVEYASRCNPPFPAADTLMKVESAYSHEYYVGATNEAFIEFVEQEEIPTELKTKAEAILAGNIWEELIGSSNRRMYKDIVYRKAVYLTCISTLTHEAINLAPLGRASIGKSFGSTKMTAYIPDDYVLSLGGLSPNALIHDHSAYDKKNAVYVVDLTKKIILFLDTPHPDTLNRLKPLLSHDKYETKFKIVDKTKSGQLRTKTVIVKGWPAVILSSAKTGLSNEEIKTRFLTITPEISTEKVQGSLNKIAERKAGRIDLVREEEDMKTWHAIFEILASDYPLNAVIPFADILAKHFAAKDPSGVRLFDFFTSLIIANTALHRYQRQSGESGVVATLQDLKDVMDVMRECITPTVLGLSGDAWMLYQSLKAKRVEEWYTQDIINVARSVIGNLDEDTIRNHYITRLVSIGLLHEDVDPLDKRKKVYTVMDSPSIKIFDDEEAVYKQVQQSEGSKHYSR